MDCLCTIINFFKISLTFFNFEELRKNVLFAAVTEFSIRHPFIHWKIFCQLLACDLFSFETFLSTWRGRKFYPSSLFAAPIFDWREKKSQCSDKFNYLGFGANHTCLKRSSLLSVLCLKCPVILSSLFLLKISSCFTLELLITPILRSIIENHIQNVPNHCDARKASKNFNFFLRLL